MFIQGDERWTGLRLGYTEDGDYTIAKDGSAITCIAESLTLAGYPITPIEVATVFQDEKIMTVDAKLIWDRVPQAFPQMHEQADGTFLFIKGKRKGRDHWILEHGKTFYDPMDGTNNLLPEFTPVGEKHAFTIS